MKSVHRPVVRPLESPPTVSASSASSSSFAVTVTVVVTASSAHRAPGSAVSVTVDAVSRHPSATSDACPSRSRRPTPCAPPSPRPPRRQRPPMPNTVRLRRLRKRGIELDGDSSPDIARHRHRVPSGPTQHHRVVAAPAFRNRPTRRTHLHRRVSSSDLRPPSPSRRTDRVAGILELSDVSRPRHLRSPSPPPPSHRPKPSPPAVSHHRRPRPPSTACPPPSPPSTPSRSPSRRLRAVVATRHRVLHRRLVHRARPPMPRSPSRPTNSARHRHRRRGRFATPTRVVRPVQLPETVTVRPVAEPPTALRRPRRHRRHRSPNSLVEPAGIVTVKSATDP